jgi:hypothetical protein
VRAVAHAELDLRLFQMSADCLHTKPKRLRDFAVQRPIDAKRKTANSRGVRQGNDDI